jgi:hypothetical protein
MPDLLGDRDQACRPISRVWRIIDGKAAVTAARHVLGDH